MERRRTAPRRSAAALVLAVAAVLASATSAADRANEVAKLREKAREFVDHFHMSPESVSLDAVLAELEERSEAGHSRPVLADWLGDEITKRWLEFAPLEPTPKGSHRYQLPFDRRVHWIVGQGISTEGSHRGSNELALDFAMPEGTEVLAARRGRVARVVDGFTECCLPVERSLETNVVLVLHYLPKPWRLYENRVRPRVRLRVSVDGRDLVSGEPFLLDGPVPTRLRVDLVEASGSSSDVSRDPGTRYVPLTPWSLRVDPGGLVVFGPSIEAWKALPEAVRRNVAIVTILFRDPDGREGFFDAWFVPGAVVPPPARDPEGAQVPG